MYSDFVFGLVPQIKHAYIQHYTVTCRAGEPENLASVSGSWFFSQAAPAPAIFFNHKNLLFYLKKSN